MKRLRIFCTALIVAANGAVMAAQAAPTQAGTALPESREAPAASSAELPAVVAAIAPSAYREVAARDTLWLISRELLPGGAATRPQVMLAVLRKNPDAFVDGSVFKMRVGSQLLIPSRTEIEAEDTARAETFFRQQQLAGNSRRHQIPSLPELRARGSGTSPRATETASSAGKPSEAETSTAAASASLVVPPIKESEPAQAARAPALPSSQTETGALNGINMLWPVLLGALGVLGVGGSVYVLRRRAPQQKGVWALKDDDGDARKRSRVRQLAERPILEQGAALGMVRLNGADEEHPLVRPGEVDVELAAACIEIGRPEEARVRLQRIIASGEGQVRDRAQVMLSRIVDPA